MAAVRHAARRLAASGSSASLSTTPRWINHQTAGHRLASTATATATLQGSSLPQDVKQSIKREASLPNPDPTIDSPSGQLVADASPFMVPTYVRPPPMFVKGEGCYLWDIDNRTYLDFTAGIAVNALGHCDQGVANILAQQGSTLVHCSNLYYNAWTGKLSKLLVEVTRKHGGMKDAARVFVCNSGSEANEAAIKFARKAGRTVDPSGNKHQLVSFHGSFHGRTLGALSATPNPKYQTPFSPMIPGFSYGTYNDIAGLETLITDKTCGVIIEPIQGEGGVNVATPEFLTALRRRCNEVGAVLIYDEIQCGLSRTGTVWAHANLPAEAHPDIITTAKALGNGFPIGATIVTEAVSSKIVTGDHGTTFGGNPLACRIAHHIVERLTEPAMLEGVQAKEAMFRKHFDALQKEFSDVITEVRGRGLILGLQLNQDPAPIITAARERGLLVITCGTNTLRFVPPLVITEQEIDSGMAILREAMRVVFRSSEQVKGTKGQEEMQAKH